ncbi:hypothetical protein ACTXT7_012851 [Hymenolepis weldensis]
MATQWQTNSPHKNPTSFHVVQWEHDDRRKIKAQTTGFFDAILEFDVTLRTVITPNLATALSKTSLPELQQQWAHRRLLPRIFYEQFNEAEPEQQESVNSDEAALNINSTPVGLLIDTGSDI